MTGTYGFLNTAEGTTANFTNLNSQLSQITGALNEIQALTISMSVIDGVLTMGAIATSSSTVSGLLSAGVASVGGALSAGSASVAGALSSASASIGGALSALSASFQGYSIVNAEDEAIMEVGQAGLEMYNPANLEGQPLLQIDNDPSFTLNCTGYFNGGMYCQTGYFTNILSNNITGGSVYVYSITGTSSHFGAYTGGKLTTNGLLYTTATGVKEYISTISGSNAYFTAITGSSIWENNMSGGSVYVYSITGTSAHFGAYTGGKLTTNGIIYTTATGGNEYLQSISGSSAYFTNIYGSIQPSNDGGVYIANTYNNLIFDTNATTNSYWNVTGNELEGSTSLFRIYNNLTGSPEVEVMGVQDSTSTTTGALVVVGGLGVGNTIHATSYSGTHGYFTNITGINCWLTNSNISTATGINSYLTNLISTNITGTNSYITYMTGTHGSFTNLTGINNFLTNMNVYTCTVTNSWLTNLSVTVCTGTNSVSYQFAIMQLLSQLYRDN